MKLSNIKNLYPEQYIWIIRSYFRLWMVKFRVKSTDPKWLASRLSLTKVENIPGIKNPNQLDNNQDMREAKRMHEAVRIAARLHLTNTECLPRSIVLLDMLNQKGRDAELKIGVAKDSKGTFASHAWIELSGVMVSEPESVGLQFKELEQPETDS